jgi:NADPH:quinone reductase-like Zn-dependent oxidoreductase
LVEVHAAGVNPFDIKVSQGYARQMAELKFPATLGGDLAGVVAEVASDVTAFKPGDEVFGQAGALSSHGSFAEFAPVKAASLSFKPSNTDFVKSAGLPLAASSAYQALVDTINLKTGEKILIHGGAGGIGSLAIQLAKHLGAHVATTAAAKDQDYVTGLGADEFADYKEGSFQTKFTGFDAVFDTVGGDNITASFDVLKPGGRLVTMAGQPDADLAAKHQVTASGQYSQVTAERLAAVAKLVEENVLTPQLDRTFPLAETAEALSYLTQGGHRGKVVIVVK